MENLQSFWYCEELDAIMLDQSVSYLLEEIKSDAIGAFQYVDDLEFDEKTNRAIRHKFYLIGDV